MNGFMRDAYGIFFLITFVNQKKSLQILILLLTGLMPKLKIS